jgi:hypothetical protein
MLYGFWRHLIQIDDITYVTRARGPIATVAHEAGRNPRQSPK